MILEWGGEEMPVSSANASFVALPNDLLNGIYVDLDDSYAFISQHTRAFRAIESACRDEDLGLVIFSEEEFDPTAKPFNWIINSVARIVVEAATGLCEEACREQGE